MKQTVYENDFIQAFIDHNRQDNFSREALILIYDYLIEYESCGEEIELDVISVCGEFSEEDILDFARRELDIDDFRDLVDEDEIFDFSTYSQKVIELSLNIPEDYKEFKVIGNKKIKKEDKSGYYRILLIGLLDENEEWLDTSNPYFVTGLDYTYYGLAFTNDEACKIGEQIPIKEKDEEVINNKSTSWEDLDLDTIREAVEEYLTNTGGFVGITSDDKVVYSEY